MSGVGFIAVAAATSSITAAIDGINQAAQEVIVEMNMDNGKLTETIAEVAGWESSVPDNVSEEGYTLTVSGSGHFVAQGANVKQNNFKDNARQIEMSGGNYFENVISLSQNPLYGFTEPQVLIKDINTAIPLRLPFPPNRNFMGREEQLSRIDEYFCKSKCHDAPCIIALTGTGGMGKTQIALEYAYRHQKKYTAVFWLSAASLDTLRISFANTIQRIVEEQVKALEWPHSAPDYNRIALKLGISGLIDDKGIVSTKPEDASAIVAAVFWWLRLPNNDKWLFVFDNADDLETFDIREYFPNHGSGSILITSRRPEFSYATQQMSVDGLDEGSAIELLLRLAQLTNRTEAVKKDATVLVKRLGFMPLAISHAGCFIHEVKLPLGEYLSYFDGAFMTVQSRKPRFGWNYQNDTAATTWEISFSKVEGYDKEAAALLLVCSYFNPEEIFESLFDQESFTDESFPDESFRFQGKSV
ncbi:hypothetical protein ABW20_dc0103006 [Dactylellina cionopaga]|nr:hypothetical protein ABW20_dc0103006 [Dactylellina cionopaga]